MSLSRLRRVVPGGLIILPGAIGLFIVMVVIFRTQSIDLTAHDHVVANLRQLKEFEAILSRQILESRFGVLVNYDPLVDTVSHLTNIDRHLASGPSAIYQKGQADVDKALEGYEDILARRAVLLEQFKSENAVLRNSLRYFPGAAKALVTLAERRNDRALSALVRELLQGVLLYNVQSGSELKAQILGVSATLRQRRVDSPALSEALRNILAHTQTILEKKEQVEQLVRELLSLPAAQRIDRLDSAYNRHHAEAIRQLAISRGFLYLSSLALLAGVGYIMLRLERSRVELERRAVEQQRLVEELSQTQDQLLQSQKMEAVGRLAGGVAHDFNNLLTVILGRSQILVGRLRPEDPAHRDVDLIKRTAGRAAELTKQLLAFSRKQVLQPKVLDLNAVIGNMSTMLRRLIGEDIDLVIAPGARLGRVKADPGQFEQIILNMVVNARDAMPSGGRLSIETRNVELDEAFLRLHPGARPGPHVLVAVRDTGIGMDEKTQQRIFEPFFTTKEPDKGTGLGLSTVYGIVKQHEGYIAVQSEPGRGATFKIYLPRVEEPVESTKQGLTHAGPPRGSETILLVEDDQEVRNLAREALEGSGYTVLEADAPGQALRVTERHPGPIHVLLTDVVMPQMSGRALAKQLSSSRPEMKVLYMSGYPDEALGDHGVLRIGTALLQKPFTPEDLARKVREVLDTREGLA